jgi:hypothetical protein
MAEGAQYAIAMTRAELSWVESLIADLEEKKLTWTREWLDALKADDRE